MTHKIGFIAGSFDVIHPGYIELFEISKQNCEHLIVGLHSDPSVDRNNKKKPILSIQERKKILLSMKFVDEVICYNTEEELYELLNINNIDVRFLGVDYKDRDFTGSELNIPIFWIDRSHGWSTTKFKKLIYESMIGS